MNARSWRLLLATSAVSGAAVALLAGASLMRAETPDRLPPLHQVHAENEVACETCHASAAEAHSASEMPRPDHEVCAGCHDVEDATACAMCHANPDAPTAHAWVVPPARLFSHATHADGGIACETCHGSTAQGEPSLPAKAICRDCHETASGMSDCAVCHAASEPLLPISHVPDWISLHGLSAHADQATCENCHTATECQDCHAGDNVRPRSHGLDFTFAHALTARASDTDCASCHTERSFCADCHRSENVLPQDHSRGDWVVPSRGGGRHAVEAQFELENCMACHDEGLSEPICADCHGK